MDFILKTSFDMNTKDDFGRTGWHWACIYGKTETAQLIIQSSIEFGIDLNAKDLVGNTIIAQDNQGRTALNLINNRYGEEYDQINLMLEVSF